MALIRANLVDLNQRRVYAAEVVIDEGKIAKITPLEEDVEGYLLPGFVDAHVHIESSLLVPSEFARMAVRHGTVATVSDPHEIANVLGVKGVEYMIDNGRQTPFKFFFGAPSCVPATIFETAGATVDANDVKALLERDDVLYLAEMMNFPGVIYNDEEVHRKIAHAHAAGKPVDGHAPGLRGEALKTYMAAGISTDHECFTLPEALEKLELGMKVLIREGSAARNFEALIPAINTYPEQLMFCSDDKHPDSLLVGHINQLCARAVAMGYDVFDVLRAACINPVVHYKLPVGTLQVGDPADCIVVNNLSDFLVQQTYLNGQLVFDAGKVLITSVPVPVVNYFQITEISKEQLAYTPESMEPVIVCNDGQLVTGRENVEASQLTPENDYLKLVVVNRYHRAPVAVAYIKNIGLKKGAIASSVAHDSHNIVAVGVDDESICRAVNLVIEHQGGLSAVSATEQHVLPLSVAGLMSADDAWKVAEQYTQLDTFSKTTLGATLRAPFMSLSFMALLVIPSIKLSDKGLFDGDSFQFIRQVS